MMMVLSRTFISLMVVVLQVAEANEPRFVADGPDLIAQVSQISGDLAKSITEVEALKVTVAKLSSGLMASTETSKALLARVQTLETTTKQLQTQGSGSTYVRWGQSACNGDGVDLVYDGYVGGSNWLHKGAATDHLCLTKDPTWDIYNSSHGNGSKLYGAQYILDNAKWVQAGNQFFNQDLAFSIVPCAVCHTKRSTTMMIPGRNRCVPGWTEEFHGYLAAGDTTHEAGSQYICLDRHPKALPGGSRKPQGKLLYLTEAVCGSLKCPPYVTGREVTCVVCSK